MRYPKKLNVLCLAFAIVGCSRSPTMDSGGGNAGSGGGGEGGDGGDTGGNGGGGGDGVPHDAGVAKGGSGGSGGRIGSGGAGGSKVGTGGSKGGAGGLPPLVDQPPPDPGSKNIAAVALRPLDPHTVCPNAVQAWDPVAANPSFYYPGEKWWLYRVNGTVSGMTWLASKGAFLTGVHSPPFDSPAPSMTLAAYEFDHAKLPKLDQLDRGQFTTALPGLYMSQTIVVADEAVVGTGRDHINHLDLATKKVTGIKGTFDYETQPFNRLVGLEVALDGSLLFIDRGFLDSPLPYVYRLDKTGKLTRHETGNQPRAIHLSLDQKSLYVTEATGLTEGALRKYQFDAAGGLVTPGTTIATSIDMAGDMTIDCAGNVYVIGRPGVFVFDSKDKKLGSIAIPEGFTLPEMIAFGGPANSRLMLGNGENWMQLQLDVPGWPY